MSKQALNNHQLDSNFGNKNEVWEEDDFLQVIDRRIKEIEAEKVLGSTWDEVKAKSKA